MDSSPPPPTSVSSWNHHRQHLNRGLGKAVGRRLETLRKVLHCTSGPILPAQPPCRSMAFAGALCWLLTCLLLCSAAPKPTCDPSTCTSCSEREVEASPTPADSSCCSQCPPACACPPHLEDDCKMQGFTSGHVPAGRSFYIDFARKLCTCGPSGDITCASLCPRLPPTCQAVGSPVADGCPRCVCYNEEEMAVPAGTVIAQGTRVCTCPPDGGQLQCSGGESKE